MTAGSRWSIGIPTWPIVDGAYDDFYVGQEVQFAVEITIETISRTTLQVKTSQLMSNSRYHVVGEVLHDNNHLLVLDFGLCGFRNMKVPDGIEVGSFVSADIYLGLDEKVTSIKNVKIPLVYSWRIERIVKEIAPLVETHDASGRKILISDRNNAKHEEITQTSA